MGTKTIILSTCLVVTAAMFLSCQPYIRQQYWGNISEIKGNDYKISIARDIKTAADSVLIVTAEHYFIRPYFEHDPIKVWWYESFDDVKIPWAITDEAVKYYIDYVTNCIHPHLTIGSKLNPAKASVIYKVLVTHYDEYKQVNWITNNNDTIIANADTVYCWYNPGDTIRWKKSEDIYRNVSVVTMILDFESVNGPLSALSFTKVRVVIFDERRLIIKVYGDGQTNYIVS